MKRLIIAFTLLAVLLLAALPAAAQNTATGIVTAYHLNVRDFPDPINGQVIARVGRNEAYLVTARSAINNWWQIRLSDGRLGWVNGAYLSVSNGHLVPVINPTSSPTTPSALGTVTAYHLNVRDTPDPFNGLVIARVRRNEVYAVVGRNANTSWWQIRLTDGRTGWVNGDFLSVINAGSVPQTSNTVPPGTGPAVTGVVTAFFLNVRTVPSPASGSIIAVIGRGQTFEVIGRTANSGWWQIRLTDGRTGWVSGAYFSVINGGGLPVTG